ncbi:MAG: MarC family protein [Pseudomonadota bacterium]
MVDLISSAFLTLFVIIDPVGLAPIFISVAKDLDDRARRSAALRSVVIAFIILVLFALAGHRFLAAMGIGIPAFRIAGGLFLFWIAFEMVFEKRTTRKSDAADRTIRDDHPDDLAAFPLAVPLMAGPGAITAIMLLAGDAGNDPVALAAIIGVLAVVLVITALFLLAAIPLDRKLGSTVRNVVTRLLGVILAALAVQFVIDGIRQAFPVAAG